MEISECDKPFVTLTKYEFDCVLRVLEELAPKTDYGIKILRDYLMRKKSQIEENKDQKDLLNYILQSVIFRHNEDISCRITNEAKLKEYMLFEKATALIEDMIEEVKNGNTDGL